MTADSAKVKRPAFQFYPGDWLNDAALRMVSVSARGLWIEMICLMHQGSDYGHLKVNGKAITPTQLGRMVGANEGEVLQWLTELDDAGVFGKKEDGTIFSRRMVRDEEIRNVRAEGGKLGGNPALVGEYNEPGFAYAMQRSSDGAVKIGISKHPAKRAYKVRQQYPNEVITMLAQLAVQDMGAYENQLNGIFGHAKNGEWFALSADEISTLLNVHLKANAKVSTKDKSTPSSSSSSSSSSSIDIPPTPKPNVRQKPRTPGDDVEFIAAWNAYPKRPGASRGDTFKAWEARRKEGVDPEAMLEGTRRYADYVRLANTEPQYIKQPQTFFGPGKHYEADWTYTPPHGRGRPSINDFGGREGGPDDGDPFNSFRKSL